MVLNYILVGCPCDKLAQAEKQQQEQKQNDTTCVQRFSKFQPTRKWVNQVNSRSFSAQNLFQIHACVISPGEERQDIFTSQPMLTYSRENTTLGQSERGYYLSYIYILIAVISEAEKSQKIAFLFAKLLLSLTPMLVNFLLLS